MRDVVNLWRIYALNDEKGVLICTWPHNNKPAIPITYNSETMTGFEYAFAVQLAAEGFVDQAIEVTQAIRDRFDGRKRNPCFIRLCVGERFGTRNSTYKA